MSAAHELKRIMRSLGIVIIFALAGPVAAVAVFGLFVLIVGVPVVQLMLEVADLSLLRNWLSIAAFVLFFFALAAAVPPSIVAGVVFALAAVYGGMNSLWAALAVTALVVIGVVTLGFFVSPSESSPLLLPGVQGLQQGAFLALYLSIPAGVAAIACWYFSRPLHRSPAHDLPSSSLS